MFDILKNWNGRLYERYLTLERNIKAKSNSFYDAFLDLLEEFLRYTLSREVVEIEGRKTCGELLRLEETKRVFCEKMGLPLEIYNKMGDYVLKINAHKHKGEKHVVLETVLSYTRLFHTVLFRVATTWGETLLPYDEAYFINLFAQFERENHILWQQLTALREELESYTADCMEETERAAYDALSQDIPSIDLDLEEQNQALTFQISSLKDIKLGILSRLSSIEAGQQQILAAVEHLSSRQSVKQEQTAHRPAPTLAEFVRGSSQAHLFLDDETAFQQKKKRCTIFLLALIGVMILSTIVTTWGFYIYSTYTLFENIYLVCVVCMLVHILRAKRVYPTADLQNNCSFTFFRTREGIVLMGKRKKKYTVFLVLSCICAALNILCAWAKIITPIRGVFFIVIFELAVFILSLVANYFVSDFFFGYTMIGLRARSATGGVQTIFYIPHQNTLISKEDFDSKFGTLRLPL